MDKNQNQDIPETQDSTTHDWKANVNEMTSNDTLLYS